MGGLDLIATVAFLAGVAVLQAALYTLPILTRRWPWLWWICLPLIPLSGFWLLAVSLHLVGDDAYFRGLGEFMIWWPLLLGHGVRGLTALTTRWSPIWHRGVELAGLLLTLYPLAKIVGLS